MALSTGTNTGSQQNTDSPQNSTSGGNFGGQKASSVQPGTATNLLSGPGAGNAGVPLSNTPLTTVSLNNAGTQATVGTTTTPAPTHHHINPTLLGLVGVVFLVAVVMFWSIARSAKSTTDY